MAKWTEKDFLEFIEVLVDHNIPLYNNKLLRKLLTRDQNLFLNQNVREGTNNVAYRTVDFDIEDLDDKAFWDKIDETRFNDVIEDNAAEAILKMAQRFNLIN